ncbi:MAG: hypothetical protein J6Y36_00605 [Treponema sp.]|nr:hypothetical protein [Treponema sp.]
MTQVNQNNLRSVLPAKIAQTVSMISSEKNCSAKLALLQFYKSPVYKELENEQTKRWWQSPYNLFEDFISLS